MLNPDGVHISCQSMPALWRHSDAAADRGVLAALVVLLPVTASFRVRRLPATLHDIPVPFCNLAGYSPVSRRRRASARLPFQRLRYSMMRAWTFPANSTISPPLHPKNEHRASHGASRPLRATGDLQVAEWPSRVKFPAVRGARPLAFA
jgi:hypothetical protein